MLDRSRCWWKPVTLDPQYYDSLPTSIRALNELAPSQRILQLFKQAKETPADGLATVALLLWAAENPGGVDYWWLHRVAGAAALGEREDARAVYINLTPLEIEQVHTLREAADLTLQAAADFIRPE